MIPGNLVTPGNLVWAALNGPQKQFAELRGAAARYRDGVAPLSAVQDWDSPEAWADLAALAGPGQLVVVAGAEARVPSSWPVLERGEGFQMTLDGSVALPEAGRATPLGAQDVPEMLDLLRLTGSGPFSPRAVELGAFLGVRVGGRLVAMGGERIRTDGWTEIGTVATDPEYRGRGLATAVVRGLVAGIRARGDDAFLHVNVANEAAISLYAGLGFTIRARTGHVAARVPSWSKQLAACVLS